MIILMQIIDEMFYLEYDQDEIQEIFKELNNGQIPLFTLLDNIGIDPNEITDSQLQRIQKALPLWESAFNICLLKWEAKNEHQAL